MHQNDSVTKKPLPADAADVQRLKGKPQFVLKPVNSGSSNPPPGNPAPVSGATSSTTPAPQVSMVRVNRQGIEPQSEPIRRHPVAEWRPHPGPTRERHPKAILARVESMVLMCTHMAGQHTEHIVYGANQHSSWLRCTLCEKTSCRVLYQYTMCMSCPRRRQSDIESLWSIAVRCVLVKWRCLLLHLLWMGTENTRKYFADNLRELKQRRHFVDAREEEEQELFHEFHEQDPHNTQGSCPSKPFEGLQQCLPWHQRARDSSSRGYSWYPQKGASDHHTPKEQPRGCAAASHVPWLPY